MLGEIIAVGDELLCGKSLDTNSRWLAQQMSDCGVSVRFHTTIGDHLDDYLTAFELACRRSDVVLCTGGLGPTEDDLTRVGLARVAGVALEFDDEAWQHIRSIFGRRARPVPEKNRVQAYFPAGARIIPNAHGTAPGIDLTVAGSPGEAIVRTRFFALPGVPAEMTEMWNSYVLAELRRMAGSRRMYHRTLRCFGAGESDIEQMIPPEVMARGRDPLVGITASEASISLRASTFATNESEGRARLESTLVVLRSVLGDLVYGEDDQTLADVVVRQMLERRQSIAIVDFGLQGLVGQWLADAPCGNDVCLASVDVWSSGAADRMFHHDRDADDPVDLEFFAKRVREHLGTTMGLAIGPLPSSPPDAKLPEFHFAVASPERVLTTRHGFGGHPAIRRPRCAKQVLNHLRLEWLR